MPARSSYRALVADIGGTQARFALVDAAGGLSAESVFDVAAFADPLAVIAAYLADRGHPVIDQAALAIAGPVDGASVALTNGRWCFDRNALAASLGLSPQRLQFLNDFAALALALPLLLPSELRQIGGGAVAPEAPKALIGPGTGLGVSGLVKAADGWVPLTGEGGHVTLAAADAREAEILALARRELGHVSAERLVSGSGLPLLYRLVCQVDGWPDQTRETLDAPAIVTNAVAGDQGCRACADTFSALLGTLAGNLALTLGARGGVYVGGGIVLRLGALFNEGLFRSRFEAKGRFSPYLAAIPVHVILATSPALRGAAMALRQGQHSSAP